MQAKKPDLSLDQFLHSSQTLEVQLHRARIKSGHPAPARKSVDDNMLGGKGYPASSGAARLQKRHTVSLDGREGRARASSAQDFYVPRLDEEEEEEAPSGSFLGNLFGFGRRKSEGNITAILESVSKEKYIRNQTLRDVLEGGDTVLIKGSWLVRRWRLGKKEDGAFGLPRRQELQDRYPSAIWKVDELFELKAKGTVNIVAVSHCWLGSQHPDPQGINLDSLCNTIELMLKSTPLDDVALFIDYCSLYQLPRTAEQEAAFVRAFPHTHIWYLHQGTRVWMLTKVSPKSERNENFEQRGWCKMERALSDMVTKSNFMLDLGLLDESCTTWHNVMKVCQHRRRVPLIPETFNEEIQKAVFAVEEDRAFIIHKYDEGFLEAIAAAEELSFSEVGWGDEEARQLALVLPHCGRLTKLALHGNKLTEMGVMHLIGVLSKCEKLDQIWVTQNLVSKTKKDVRDKLFEAWTRAGRMREGLRM